MADEMTQETFIHVYFNLSSYKGRGSVSSWIYRIATNPSSDKLRKIVRKRRWGRKISLETPLSEGEKKELIEIVDSNLAPVNPSLCLLPHFTHKRHQSCAQYPYYCNNHQKLYQSKRSTIPFCSIYHFSV